MNATLSEFRPVSSLAPDALLWIPVGAVHVPVEVTIHPDVVAFEAPDWVPEAVLDRAHRIIFGKPA